jgi:hypothetical protein
MTDLLNSFFWDSKEGAAIAAKMPVMNNIIILSNKENPELLELTVFIEQMGRSPDKKRWIVSHCC